MYSKSRFLDSCSLKEALFSDYRIQSNAGNIISVGVSPDALLQALRSASPSTSSSGALGGGINSYANVPAEVVVRLAKKNGQAVLALEITFDGSGSGKVVVAHDVLIDVLKPAEMAKLKEPLCPEPDVRPRPFILFFWGTNTLLNDKCRYIFFYHHLQNFEQLPITCANSRMSFRFERTNVVNSVSQLIQTTSEWTPYGPNASYHRWEMLLSNNSKTTIEL